MEDMTMEWYNEEVDSRLVDAKRRLGAASIALTEANNEYLEAIALHISICAEIRGYNEA